MKEVYVPSEMLAAGIEAKGEAVMDCLPEADIVLEIYLAMYGMGLKAMCEREETLH